MADDGLTSPQQSGQEPQEGQVWRERNQKRAGRKVVVEQVRTGFDNTDKVWIRGLSYEDGTTRTRPGPRTKVKLALWHNTFVLVEEEAFDAE